MNSKNRKTLAAIFAKPTKKGVRWASVESLFVALGADLTKRGGSMVRVDLNGRTIVFHRPHGKDPMSAKLVERVREYLAKSGHVPN